jgi:hypothetical protein
MIFRIGRRILLAKTVPEVSYCGSSDDMIVPQNLTRRASLQPLYNHYLPLLLKVTTPSYNIHVHIKSLDCLSCAIQIF